MYELFCVTDENAPAEPTDISTIFEAACSTGSSSSSSQRRVTWDKGVHVGQGRGIAKKPARRPRLAFAPGKVQRNASEFERKRQAAVARYAVESWDDILTYVAKRTAKTQRDLDIDAVLAQTMESTCGVARTAPGAPLKPRAASSLVNVGFPEGWPQLTGLC